MLGDAEGEDQIGQFLHRGGALGHYLEIGFEDAARIAALQQITAGDRA